MHTHQRTREIMPDLEARELRTQNQRTREIMPVFGYLEATELRTQRPKNQMNYATTRKLELAED